MATTDIGEILAESVPAKLNYLTNKLDAMATMRSSDDHESLVYCIRELAEIVGDVYRKSQLPF